MEHMQLSDAALARGRGGFWIDPDGLLVPVENYAEHWETTTRLGIKHGYTGAYNLGMVRVSLYDHRTVSVNYDRRYVTVAALQTAARLLRHAHFAAGWGNTWELTYEEVLDRVEAYHRYDTPDQLARRIMQDAIERNAEAKQAQRAAIAQAGVMHQLMGAF